MTPIFRSTFSYGKSILTLDGESKESGSDSLIQICKENNIKNVVLVEDNLTSFMKAFKACEANGLDLYYGLRITFCNDMSEEGDSSDHKNIIFAKDDDGCKLLNKIYSKAFTEGGGRIDYSTFKEFWNPDHLSFVVPFYDSFIHENNFKLKRCLPDIKDFNPTFWQEYSELPFDHLILKKVQEYTDGKYKLVKVKSIFYKDRKDVEALQTYKILSNRSFSKNSSLSSPNLDHFGSDQFCFESYLQQR